MALNGARVVLRVLETDTHWPHVLSTCGVLGYPRCLVSICSLNLDGHLRAGFRERGF